MALCQCRGKALIVHSIRVRGLRTTLQARGLGGPVDAAHSGIVFTLPNARGDSVRGLPIIIFKKAFHGAKSPGPPVHSCSKLILLRMGRLSSLRRTMRVHRRTTAVPRALLTFVNFDKGDIGVIVPFALPSKALPRSPRRVGQFRSRTCLATIGCCRPRLKHGVALGRPIPRRKYHVDCSPRPMCGPSTITVQVRRPTRVPSSRRVHVVPRRPSRPLRELVPNVSHGCQVTALFDVTVMSTVQGSKRVGSKSLGPIFALLTSGYLGTNVPRRSTMRYALLCGSLESGRVRVHVAFQSICALGRTLTKGAFVPRVVSLALRLRRFVLHHCRVEGGGVDNRIRCQSGSLLHFAFDPFAHRIHGSVYARTRGRKLGI